MKSCLTSLIVKEMLIRYHSISHSWGWLLQNKQKIASIGEDVEKYEHLKVAGQNTNCAIAVENSIGVPQKIKHRIAIWSAILPLSIYLKFKVWTQTDMCTPIFIVPLFTTAKICEKPPKSTNG